MRTEMMSMWLRRIGPLGLAGLLALPAPGEAVAEKTSGTGPSHSEVYQAGHDALSSVLDGVEKQRREALDLADKGDYQGANALFLAALKKIESLPGDFVIAKRAEINTDYRRFKISWANEIMLGAQKLAREKKYKEAISEAQRAQQLDMDRKFIASFIEECQNRQLGSDFRAETDVKKVSPDLEKRRSEIDYDLREAKLFFRNKQYESACTRLERVLLVDPFNMDAIEILNLCYDRLFNAGKARSAASMAGVDARNIWEWVEPLEPVQLDRSTDRRATVRRRGNTDLYNRLERIVFPIVPLKDSTLMHIISYLNEKSRAYDPEKQGVVILDNLSPEDKQRKISFELGKMPLLDIIRYLSMASGLSYSFRGDKVVFGNVDSMSTEFFPVRGDIIAEIIDSQLVKQTSSGMAAIGEGGGGGGGGGAGAGAGGGGGAGDAGNAGGMNAGAALGGGDAGGTAEVGMGAAPAAGAQVSAEQQRNSAALKAYFSDRWITFDNGANIIYSPLGERLVVKNTAENLRRMDALLRQLDALDQPMILVEAKLIELTDTNLNELGFEWMFSASPADGSGSWSMGTTDPTRHGKGSNMFRILNDLKVLPNFGEKIFGSDVNVDLSLSINAVSQNRRAEVLASPRILSQSGQKTPAKIQMTEKTYFVTEWEAPDVESNGFTLSLDTPQPDWDTEYDLGVTFTVKPSVGADNYTITLENIHPIFLTHTKDYDNIVTFEAGQIINGVRVPTVTQTFNLRMPEIARREIDATITLYDGETVLLGGMADNESLARDDKWPILGSIPLIGNFFRDQQTDVTNRTLLIFITARLVNSNGVPLRSIRDRGLIEFNR